MKKVLIPVLLASAMCVGLAGCGNKEGENNNNNNNNNNNTNPTVTITENTDPKTLVGEKVDRTGWTAAFADESNYTMKSVVTSDLTQNGNTMSESVTLIYRFTADKYQLALSMKEGGKMIFEAEVYMELDGDTVSMWQRGKEGTEWSEWDGETYNKEDLGEIFGLTSDLSFLKENYANFSYVDADKGYSATASGLSEMQEELDAFAESILGILSDDSLQFDLSKFVLKLNGGKPGACLIDLTLTAEEAATPETRDNEGETPESGEQPEGGNDGDGADQTPDEGENGDTMPETPAPITGNIALTQLFYDYGKTTVTRPENLPSLDDDTEETPDADPDLTPDEDDGQNGEEDNTRRIRLF